MSFPVAHCDGCHREYSDLDCVVEWRVGEVTFHVCATDTDVAAMCIDAMVGSEEFRQSVAVEMKRRIEYRAALHKGVYAQADTQRRRRLMGIAR